jgi:PBSX family phage terminase large subunit
MKITTTQNFAFIQSAFIESKLAANLERKTGIPDPERLKGIGLEGASRTGKSWDISVFLCHYVGRYQGKQVNVCRDHLTNLKKTFYETFKKVWIYQFGYPATHFNKTASDIHFNGNIIRFVGINDDIMTSHGLESDLLIINEAMGVEKESINQLEQRCNDFFIYDYNPSEVESHLYDKEIDPSYRLHKSTIFDNPYAPLNAKAKILSYAHPEVDDKEVAIKAGYLPEAWQALKQRNHDLKTSHKYNWEVYGLGKRAVGDDVIFTGWQEYKVEPEEGTLDWVHLGGDFGFKTDPTAAVRVKKQGNNLYLKELIYEPGLLNPDIAVILRRLGEDKARSIWDRAEEKSIFELRSMDVDAWYSEKGPGSVSFGIQKMHQFNIFIHEDSNNLKNEFYKYRWAKERNGSYKRNTFGKRIPVDKDNHGIDAVRYVMLYYYWEATENGHGSDT